jgi:hypothetical protein
MFLMAERYNFISPRQFRLAVGEQYFQARAYLKGTSHSGSAQRLPTLQKRRPLPGPKRVLGSAVIA